MAFMIVVAYLITKRKHISRLYKAVQFLYTLKETLNIDSVCIKFRYAINVSLLNICDYI
jgi:hypothetical protein